MESKHIPHPWIEERARIGPYTTKDEHLGFSGKLAVFIASKFGSMGAFYFLITWMVVWMILASLGIGLFKLDPYPFTFLLIMSNLIQLLSMPILAVGQQVLNRSSDKQAEQTYKDAETLLKLQDEVRRLIEINSKQVEEIHSVIVSKNKD